MPIGVFFRDSILCSLSILFLSANSFFFLDSALSSASLSRRSSSVFLSCSSFCLLSSFSLCSFSHMRYVEGERQGREGEGRTLE
jgi:hypothetical protein